MLAENKGNNRNDKYLLFTHLPLGQPKVNKVKFFLPI